jgi:hypothetical protein
LGRDQPSESPNKSEHQPPERGRQVETKSHLYVTIENSL